MKLPSRTRRLAKRRGFNLAKADQQGFWSLSPTAGYPIDPCVYLAEQLRGTKWEAFSLNEISTEDLIGLLDAPTVTVGGKRDERVPLPARVGRPAVPIADRFWGRMDPDADPNACWHWPGSLNFYGYGVLAEGSRSDKRVRQAHIVAYEAVNGLVPTGLHIDHTCHGADLDCPGGGPQCLHRRCVNPAHLEAVSP